MLVASMVIARIIPIIIPLIISIIAHNNHVSDRACD